MTSLTRVRKWAAVAEVEDIFGRDGCGTRLYIARFSNKSANLKARGFCVIIIKQIPGSVGGDGKFALLWLPRMASSLGGQEA